MVRLVEALNACSRPSVDDDAAPFTESELTNEYDQAPATQVAAPFSLPAPDTDTDTIVLSPAAVPPAPPTAVAATFVRYGKVRAVPLADASVPRQSARSHLPASRSWGILA